MTILRTINGPITHLYALISVFLISCAQYPEPEPGVYPITLILVEDHARTHDWCGGVACADPANIPCPIMLTTDGWHIYSNHELAHCLGINEHD